MDYPMKCLDKHDAWRNGSAQDRLIRIRSPQSLRRTRPRHASGADIDRQRRLTVRLQPWFRHVEGSTWGEALTPRPARTTPRSAQRVAGGNLPAPQRCRPEQQRRPSVGIAGRCDASTTPPAVLRLLRDFRSPTGVARLSTNWQMRAKRRLTCYDDTPGDGSCSPARRRRAKCFPLPIIVGGYRAVLPPPPADPPHRRQG